MWRHAVQAVTTQPGLILVAANDDVTHQPGLILVAANDEPARTLRHEDEADKLDESWQRAKSQHPPDENRPCDYIIAKVLRGHGSRAMTPAHASMYGRNVEKLQGL